MEYEIFYDIFTIANIGLLAGIFYTLRETNKKLDAFRKFLMRGETRDHLVE